MSVTPLPQTGAAELDALIGEHVNTLLHRAKMSGRALAPIIGVSQAAMAAKINGRTWKFSEVVAACDYFGVTLEEMSTALPSLAEWQQRWEAGAQRKSHVYHSRQESASPEAVNHGLAVNRRPRHLWVVAS